MKKEKNRKKIWGSGLMIFAIILMCSCTTVEAAKIKNANQAQKAALKKVPSAQVVEVDTDMENGVLVYEVELYKGKKEYSLQYRASNGKLLEYEWEISGYYYGKQNKKNLSKKEIRKKALKKVKNATVTSTNLIYDDGMAEYKVKLKKGSKKYELIYNSKTGKLIKYEWKITPKKSGAASTSYIGTTKAKSIARKEVSGATVLKVEFDKDDGKAVYEVSMVKGIYEYEVKIDAKTGKILEIDKDIDD